MPSASWAEGLSCASSECLGEPVEIVGATDADAPTTAELDAPAAKEALNPQEDVEQVLPDEADSSAASLQKPVEDVSRSAALLAEGEGVLPGAPTLTSAVGGDYSAELSWRAPEGDEEILGYRVYRDGRLLNSASLVASCSFEDTSLGAVNTKQVAPVASYQVSAVTAAGEGPLSEPLSLVRQNQVVQSDIPYVPTANEAAAGIGTAVPCIFSISTLATDESEGKVSVGFNTNGVTIQDSWFTSAVDNSLSGALTIPDTVEIAGKTYRVTYLNSYCFGFTDAASACDLSSVTFRCHFATSNDRVGMNAGSFANCSNLREVVFAPECRMRFSGGAFLNCTNLTTLRFQGPASNMDFASDPVDNSQGWITGAAFRGCRVKTVLYDDDSSYSLDSSIGRLQVPWNVDRTTAAAEYVRVALYDSLASSQAGNPMATCYVEKGAPLASFLPMVGQSVTSPSPAVYAGADALPALPEGATGWVYDAGGSDTLVASIDAYATRSAETLGSTVVTLTKSGVFSRLAWKNVDGVTSWDVYRAVDDGAFELVATFGANTNTFLDTYELFSKPCSYYVVGRSASGASAKSNVVKAAGSDPLAPTAPVVTSVKESLSSTYGCSTQSGTSAVRVAFSSVTGNFGSLVTEYRLYRARLDGGGNPVGDYALVESISASTSNYLVDRTLSAADWGVTFGYRVVAVNGVGESPASNDVAITYAPQAGDTVSSWSLTLADASGQRVASVPVTYRIAEVPNGELNGAATLESVDGIVADQGGIVVPASVGSGGFNFDVTSVKASDWAVKVPGLTFFTYPDNGRVEESGALFSQCPNLERITYPAGMKVLSAKAADSCTKLSTVDLPEGLETMEAGCLNGCSALTSLVFPASLRSIKGYITTTKSATYSVDKGRNAITTLTFLGDASAITFGDKGNTFTPLRNLKKVLYRGDGLDSTYFPTGVTVTSYYTVYYYDGYADADAGENLLGMTAFRASTTLASIAAGTASSTARWSDDKVVKGTWDLEGGAEGKIAASQYAVPKGSVRPVAPPVECEVPSAPQSLRARGQAGGVTLNWAAPADDGGAEITGYNVYCDGVLVNDEPLDPSEFLNLLGTYTYQATGLEPASTHEFRVAAVNPAGEGPQSAAVEVTVTVQQNDIITAKAQVIDGDGAETDTDMRFRVTKLATAETAGTVEVYADEKGKAVALDTAGTLVVPDEITYAGERYAVTSIASYAFSENGSAAKSCSQLTGISLPGGLTSLGSCAFNSCKNLKTITFRGDAPQNAGAYGSLMVQNAPTDTVVYYGAAAPEGTKWHYPYTDSSGKLVYKVNLTEYVVVDFVDQKGVALGQAAIKRGTACDDVSADNDDLVVLWGSVPRLDEGLIWSFDVDYQLSRAAVATVAKAPVTRPGAPCNLAGEVASGQVTLTWEQPQEGGSSLSFNVYRDGQLATAQPIQGYSFVDTGLEDGREYAYTVTAINAAGESVPSEPLLATPVPQKGSVIDAFAPVVPQGQDEAVDVPCRYQVVKTAADGQPGQVFLYGSTSGGALHDCTSTGELVIPEAIQYGGQTYEVVAIGPYALSGSIATSVVVPSSVALVSEYMAGSRSAVSRFVFEGKAPVVEKLFSNGTYNYAKYFSSLRAIVWGEDVDDYQSKGGCWHYAVVRYYSDQKAAQEGNDEVGRVAVLLNTDAAHLVDGELESDEILAGYGLGAVPDAPEGKTWRYSVEQGEITSAVVAYAWSEEDEDPGEPDNPDKPSDPDEPADPVNPDKPGDSDNPESPDKPSDPTPESPDADKPGSEGSGTDKPGSGDVVPASPAAEALMPGSSSGTPVVSIFGTPIDLSSSNAAGLSSSAASGNVSTSADSAGSGSGASSDFVISDSYPSSTVAYQVGEDLWLQFSKNVAAVAAANADKITLTTADGTPVAIKVWAADPNTDFDHRQYLYITPLEPLDAETTYVLSVAPGVVAKNGMAFEASWRVTFVPGQTGVVETTQVISGQVQSSSATTDVSRVLSERMARTIVGIGLGATLLFALIAAIRRIRREKQAVNVRLQ